MSSFSVTQRAITRAGTGSELPVAPTGTSDAKGGVEPLNKRKTSELEANTSSDSTDGDEYVQSSSEDDDALISECIENTIPEEELTPMSDEEKTGKAKPKKAKVDKPQVTKGKATTAKATTAKATKAKATKAKVTTTKVTTAKVTTAKATKPDSLREASKSKSNDDADHAVPADDGNTLPILALKANAPPKRGAAAAKAAHKNARVARLTQSERILALGLRTIAQLMWMIYVLLKTIAIALGAEALDKAAIDADKPDLLLEFKKLKLDGTKQEGKEDGEVKEGEKEAEAGPHGDLGSTASPQQVDSGCVDGAIDRETRGGGEDDMAIDQA